MLPFARPLLAVLTCSSGAFAFGNWPEYAPFGQDVYVNGTCQPGFQTTDPSAPTQRLCTAAGTYTSTIRNPCIRACPAPYVRQATCDLNTDHAGGPCSVNGLHRDLLPG